MMDTVYLLRHRESGREYVGRTGALKLRLAAHRGSAKAAKTPIAHAIREFGFEAFDLIVLAEVREWWSSAAREREREEMLRRKTFWPDGFNLANLPREEMLARSEEWRKSVGRQGR